MTFLEKLKIEKPDVRINEFGPKGCPADYEYSDYKVGTSTCPIHGEPDSIPHKCLDCWNQEIPEKEVMTYAKKRMAEHGYTMEELASDFCPYEFDYERFEDRPCEYIEDKFVELEISYAEAWKSLQDAKHISQKMILDSGERREFETGAVRDIQEGKGRCDLMPLNVVGYILEDNVLVDIESFKENGDPYILAGVLRHFNGYTYMNIYTMFLEVAKHFEDGAKKYGENNWQKGIPTKHYIDSAVRHYLKHLRGDQDEPHDRAFVWNILCCMWTCLDNEKWALNDYLPKEGG